MARKAKLRYHCRSHCWDDIPSPSCFPVGENDRYDVNAHSKNDKKILTKLQGTTTSADTMTPNLKVTLIQTTLTGSWMCQLRCNAKYQPSRLFRNNDRCVCFRKSRKPWMFFSLVPQSVRNTDLSVIKKQHVLTIRIRCKNSVFELDECETIAI